MKSFKLTTIERRESGVVSPDILSKDKDLRSNLYIMMLIWSFGSFSFFLIPFYLSSIPADFFVLSFSSEVAEYLGSIICLFITRCVRLERAISFFTLLIALSSLGLLLVKLLFKAPKHDGVFDYHDAIEGSLVMLTNLGVVCAFDIAYLINP